MGVSLAAVLGAGVTLTPNGAVPGIAVKWGRHFGHYQGAWQGEWACHSGGHCSSGASRHRIVEMTRGNIRQTLFDIDIIICRLIANPDHSVCG